MDKLPIRVVIADSHDLFRQGLSSLLTRQLDIKIVGEAKDGDELLQMMRDLRPDVLLMEVYMRGVDGLQTVYELMAEYSETTIAILTSSEDDNDVLSAVKMGVKGYILKNSSLDELVQAVQALSQGGAYFSSSMFTKVLQEFTHLARRRDLQEAKGIDALTDREKDVLRLVARGATNRDIAEELIITENTVKVHLRNILDKLQLRNRQQAAAYAVQEGLVTRVMLGTTTATVRAVQTTCAAPLPPTTYTVLASVLPTTKFIVANTLAPANRNPHSVGILFLFTSLFQPRFQLLQRPRRDNLIRCGPAPPRRVHSIFHQVVVAPAVRVRAIDSKHPASIALLIYTSSRSSLSGDAFTSIAAPVRAASRITASTSISDGSR